MKTITAEEFVGIIRAKATEASSLRQLAREMGVNVSTLSRLLRGEDPPGPKLLDLLGYQRVVMYRRIKEHS